MPVYLWALPRTREEHRASALGRLEGQLVEGEDLSPSLEDATSGWTAHSQCTQLGRSQNPHIICDHPHNHSCFVLSAEDESFRLMGDKDRGGRLLQLINNPFSTT